MVNLMAHLCKHLIKPEILVNKAGKKATSAARIHLCNMDQAFYSLGHIVKI